MEQSGGWSADIVDKYRAGSTRLRRSTRPGSRRAIGVIRSALGAATPWIRHLTIQVVIAKNTDRCSVYSLRAHPRFHGVGREP
jgi:hypothetical protein